MKQGGEERRQSERVFGSVQAKLVQRMLMPNGPSANKLSQEVGINQPPLSRWLREATTLVPVTKRRKPPITTKSRPSEPKQAEDRTADEKLRLVLEAGALPEADLGEFLRRHGLHEADLAAWREAALTGLAGGQSAPPRSGEAKRVCELEKELRRKDRALAETAALLVLQKNYRAWQASQPAGTETPER